MLEFDDYEDTFDITGRCATFTSSKFVLPEGMYDPDQLRGETILLCGVEVRVIGVETFAIPRSPSSPYRHSFGLGLSFEDGEKVRANHRS